MTDLPGSFDAALVAAVLETFENLAFMEPEFTPGRAFADDGALRCSLAIHSPLRSTMEMAMGDDLAAAVAGTIWSIDKTDVDEQMRRDIVAELLNTIAGRFMKTLVPVDRTFQLGLPEFSARPGAVRQNLQLFPFSLGGGMFRIALMAPEGEPGAP